MAGAFETAKALAAELKAATIANQDDYDHYDKRVSKSLRALDAAWTNDAVATEAAKIKNELLEAWEAKSR